MDPELLNQLLLMGSAPVAGVQPPPVPPALGMVSSPASLAPLGSSLDPVPMPQPRPAEAPGGTYANAGVGVVPPTGPTSADARRLTDSLRGVIAPQAPVAQKVSTPHAPPMAKLQGGNVAELLASLGIGPQQAFPGLKLPSTLGQALGGR